VLEGLDAVAMELEKIYVLPQYWDKKAGAELMKKAIEVTKLNGFKYLYLGVWQENKRALTFYNKFGFVSFNTRTFH
jgi:diamine N-acetyltransferase